LTSLYHREEKIMATTELRPSRSVRERKLAELSAASGADIVAGFDADGKRYSMTIEDQKNILALSLAAAQGQSVPYHADGEPCRLYSAEEFTALAEAATAFTVGKTTYFNALKQWVTRTEDGEAVNAIYYGADLPDDLAEYVAGLLGGGTAE
jgi:hypothetical protein